MPGQPRLAPRVGDGCLLVRSHSSSTWLAPDVQVRYMRLPFSLNFIVGPQLPGAPGIGVGSVIVSPLTL